jgi:hypothetical protein
MEYRGSCHCGRVAFEVTGDITGALECNCSICHRKGSLLWFVPRGQMRLTTPDDAAETYAFNKHLIRHRFCRVCGMHPFAEASDPKGNPMAAINLRCLEGVDLAPIPVRQFDGKAI